MKDRAFGLEADATPVVAEIDELGPRTGIRAGTIDIAVQPIAAFGHRLHDALLGQPCDAALREDRCFFKACVDVDDPDDIVTHGESRYQIGWSGDFRTGNFGHDVGNVQPAAVR